MAKFQMNRNPPPPPVPESDPTGFLLDNSFSDFVLMTTPYIKYMVMLGYTFMHGSKLFPTFSSDTSLPYKFVSMILQCTGGGILVPIFINSIPVPLGQDAYPLAIIASFLLHQYVPILREIMKLSPVVKYVVLFLYETMRAFVVVKFTSAAGAAIAPTEFAIPVFGPIFCGTVAGCGGAFLPFTKGLEPLKSGMAPPMTTAFVAATFYHLFTQTSLSSGVSDASKKAQVIVTTFFIASNMYLTAWPTSSSKKKD